MKYPKINLFIKVCTITTFFQVLHRKINFFEKLTRPSALGPKTAKVIPTTIKAEFCPARSQNALN